MRCASACLLVMLIACPAAAQERKAPSPWDAWAFLVGTWESVGKPEEGQGRFSLEPALDGKVLIRKNVTELPATKERPGGRHEDLMIVSPGPTAGAYAASYWDNEGHAIAYRAEVASDGRSATFVTDAAAPGPRFRLTYLAGADGVLTIRFEIAPPGKPDAFKVYLEGHARRKPVVPTAR